MNKKHAYSVVIPLFNKQDTIIRAINSVFNQDHDIEIIVVNDGSTDDSVTFINSYKYNNLKIIEQSNMGVSSARNRGLLESTHDLVAFLDADDEWLPNFLNIIDNLINKYPYAGAYATAFQWIDDNSIIKNKNNKLKHSYGGLISYFDSIVNNSDPFCASSIVVRKNLLIDLGGFNENLWFGEDIDAWVKLALYSQIAYNSEIGANYYQNIPERAVKLKKPITHHFSETINIYMNNNIIENENIFLYANKSLCLFAFKNIRNGYSIEARHLLRHRSSDKLLPLIILCFILSYLPSGFINLIYSLWIRMDLSKQISYFEKLTKLLNKFV